jgi:putative ABC transport system permease protein
MDDALRQDLFSASRALRRSPGYCLTAVVTTALAVGMATLAFGLRDALLRPPPFPEPGRLVAVRMASPDSADSAGRVSWSDFAALSRSRSFAAQALYRSGPNLTLLGSRGPERVLAVTVSPDLFRVLGIAPLSGRSLRADDGLSDAPPVILLGDALSRRTPGGNAGVAGRTVTVDEAPVQVAGVMPPGFRFPYEAEAWIPLAIPPGPAPPRTARNLSMVARLRPGVSVEQARAEVREIGERLAALSPEANAGWRTELAPLSSALLSPWVPQLLRVIAGAAALILLIAAANLTHLVLVRSAARRRELAVRAAFGASPARIARQILTESSLLAGAGGVLGAAAAALALRAAEPLRERMPVPYWLRLSPPGPAVFLFALAATAAFALVLALPAILGELRPDLAAVLKDGGAAGSGPRRQRFRAALVVSEVALAVVLLVGASLMVRTFLILRQERGGIAAERLLSVGVVLPGERYADGAVRARRIEDLLRRLRAIPGVAAAAASHEMLLRQDETHGVAESEDPRGVPGRRRSVLYYPVSTDYFRTLGAPLVRGRAPTASETAAGAEVAVVNRTLAQWLWRGESPIGQRVRLIRGQIAETFTVVGEAGDIRHRILRLPADPCLYIPLARNPRRQAGLLLRTASDPRMLLPEVERRIHAADPHLPVFSPATLDELRADSLIPDRLWSRSYVLFAAGALFLALLGVYGVLSAAVAQQMRAIGIRLALGAGRGTVVGRIVGRGLLLTLLGLGLGFAGALVLGRRLVPIAFEVSLADPIGHAAVAILLLDTAFIACWLPARRVLDVDPAETLRNE